MKRRSVHCAFAAAALACGILAGYHEWRVQRGQHINAAISGARMSQFDASVPEARFARALELARAGELEAALKSYRALAHSPRHDLKLGALYNTGNLYMRTALSNGQAEAFKSLPLIELAKRSYRDLLREDPFDWDARYNLERALWLAPEIEPAAAEQAEPPKKEQSVSTLQGARIDLP
ncbi:MAG TPA: hypothetical protein VGN07_13605 [Steroidobacteraceae bacterium]|jgi:mxaK protein